jgi:benzoate-CoA ligase
MQEPPPELFNIAEHFIDRPAQAAPDKPAILGEPRALSYEGLRKLTHQAANAFRRLGCEPRDRVLIVLPDSADFIAAFFGAVRIGAIAVPVNPMTRSPDYAFYVEDLSPRVCVVHEMAWPEFFSALEGRKESSVLLRCGGPGMDSRFEAPVENSGARRILSWEACLSKENAEAESQQTNREDAAFFLYTSGSGGRPKAAIHRHGDMLATTEGYARGILGIQPDDITFSVSKLFFAYGLGNAMYFPFSVGASTVLLPERPRPERVAAMLAKYRPSLFFSVPTFYGALLQAADAGLQLDFSSVRIPVSAGEMLPPEIFEQFRRRFGLEILEGIGSTEMLHMFMSSRVGRVRPGSCGWEVPGCEAKILDDAFQPVADGEIGNLWVKGKSALTGYWKRPELSGAVKREDWVFTGDKFSREPDGYYRYCGRKDDMFKVSGMWVSPGEVENALLAHKSVAEAAVIARPDSAGLSRVVAFVVLRDGDEGDALAGEILNFVKSRLPGYKCPRELRVVRELPKTATGKIQRFRLRDNLAPAP